MMRQPELLERLGPPAGLESSPCPLDDTVVGQHRHYSESTTGRRSDSQSVIGTYRTPVSDPANYILGITAVCIAVLCTSLSLVSYFFFFVIFSAGLRVARTLLLLSSNWLCSNLILRFQRFFFLLLFFFLTPPAVSGRLA